MSIAVLKGGEHRQLGIYKDLADLRDKLGVTVDQQEESEVVELGELVYDKVTGRLRQELVSSKRGAPERDFAEILFEGSWVTFELVHDTPRWSEP